MSLYKPMNLADCFTDPRIFTRMIVMDQMCFTNEGKCIFLRDRSLVS